MEKKKEYFTIRNNKGDYAIIPIRYKREVMDMIKEKCFRCLEKFLETLPKHEL